MAAVAVAEVENRLSDFTIDQEIGADGTGSSVDFGYCAICLEKIQLHEAALLKGCEHAYCVTCILRWASYKENPLCPQCKNPFETLSLRHSLDGSVRDSMYDECIWLLLGATWFVPFNVERHKEILVEPEEFYHYEYEQEADDYDDCEVYYMSNTGSIRIGNRRWGDNGYVRAGRKEASPTPGQHFLEDSDAGPSRTTKKKEASRDLTGKRAKKAQKREAADKAAAEKHQQRLQRLGRI